MQPGLGTAVDMAAQGSADAGPAGARQWLVAAAAAQGSTDAGPVVAGGGGSGSGIQGKLGLTTAVAQVGRKKRW